MWFVVCDEDLVDGGVLVVLKEGVLYFEVFFLCFECVGVVDF